MCGIGDGDECGRDVVHDYVWGLPDDAAACLGVGGAGGGWSEDNQRIRVVSRSQCWGSVECGQVVGDGGRSLGYCGVCWEMHLRELQVLYVVVELEKI